MRKSRKIISLINKGNPLYTGVSCNDKYYYITEKKGHYCVRLKYNDLEDLTGVHYQMLHKENEERLIGILLMNKDVISEYLLTEENKINDIIVPILKPYLNDKYSDICPDIVTLVELLKILRFENETLHIYCLSNGSIMIYNHYDLSIIVMPNRIKEVLENEY